MASGKMESQFSGKGDEIKGLSSNKRVFKSLISEYYFNWSEENSNCYKPLCLLEVFVYPKV